MKNKINNKSIKPPKFAAWILSILIDSSVRDQAIGDLIQQYIVIFNDKGPTKAKLWYFRQITAAVPSFLNNMFYWGFTMFLNYLKFTFRNIKRQKLYSAIHIFGLSIGFACCILIYLFVRNELSYDKYHDNSKNIYRVILDREEENGVRHLSYTYAPMAPALKTDYPEISSAVRFCKQSVSVEYLKEKKFQENRFFFTDSTIFKIFSFKLFEGSSNTVLNSPNSILITKNMAEKYFGDTNPLGKVLKIENKLDLTITGVLENIPENSHFKFDFLTPFENLEKILGYKTNWHWPMQVMAGYANNKERLVKRVNI